MIIRISLCLSAKPALAYDKIMKINFLILPSPWQLMKCKNIIKPKAGFNRKIIDELVNKSKHWKRTRRHLSFIIDKVKVQQKLIKDKCTHQLIVYVDLGVTQLNFSTFNYCDALASYISVVFFILEEHYVTLSLQ